MRRLWLRTALCRRRLAEGGLSSEASPSTSKPLVLRALGGGHGGREPLLHTPRAGSQTNGFHDPGRQGPLSASLRISEMCLLKLRKAIKVKESATPTRTPRPPAPRPRLCVRFVCAKDQRGCAVAVQSGTARSEVPRGSELEGCIISSFLKGRANITAVTGIW